MHNSLSRRLFILSAMTLLSPISIQIAKSESFAAHYVTKGQNDELGRDWDTAVYRFTCRCLAGNYSDRAQSHLVYEADSFHDHLLNTVSGLPFRLDPSAEGASYRCVRDEDTGLGVAFRFATNKRPIRLECPNT